jgi:hypothetical protein
MFEEARINYNKHPTFEELGDHTFKREIKAFARTDVQSLGGCDLGLTPSPSSLLSTDT